MSHASSLSRAFKLSAGDAPGRRGRAREEQAASLASAAIALIACFACAAVSLTVRRSRALCRRRLSSAAAAAGWAGLAIDRQVDHDRRHHETGGQSRRASRRGEGAERATMGWRDAGLVRTDSAEVRERQRGDSDGLTADKGSRGLASFQIHRCPAVRGSLTKAVREQSSSLARALALSLSWRLHAARMPGLVVRWRVGRRQSLHGSTRPSIPAHDGCSRRRRQLREDGNAERGRRTATRSVTQSRGQTAARRRQGSGERSQRRSRAHI